MENLIAAAPRGTEASFYRSSAGAEIDLVRKLPSGALWAIEIKRTTSPKVTRGFHIPTDELDVADHPSQTGIDLGREIQESHWTESVSFSDTHPMNDIERAHTDLVHIEPSKNMARFYGIALQPTLFGEIAAVRCWGRIGTRRRTISVTYRSAGEAEDAFTTLERVKRHRGYTKDR